MNVGITDRATIIHGTLEVTGFANRSFVFESVAVALAARGSRVR